MSFKVGKNRFRLDRALTIGLYPLYKKIRVVGDDAEQIPVLMYHSISKKPEIVGHPYFETNTFPETFRSQMEYLHRNGYSSVSLAEIYSLSCVPKSEGKTVVITFDDGYADFREYALPVLSELGFFATVFVPTSYIGIKRKEFMGRECMTWSEIRECMKHGTHFGSHSSTHPRLDRLTFVNMEDELKNSKMELEMHLGKEIDSFSFPFAFPETDKRFITRYQECLERQGYRIAVNTRIGRVKKGIERFSIPRIPINDYDDVSFLKAKLEGGYDWMGYLQYGKKMISGSGRVIDGES